ncbi:MAG: carboxylesterase family protein, partial [Planctomycetota bacterium]
EILEVAAPTINPAASDGMGFGLVVDGRALPDDPFVLMSARKIADVPLLIGTAADEGTIFVAASPHTQSVAAYRAFVRSVFVTESDRVLERYAPASDEDVKGTLAALLADSLFVAPARSFVRARASGATAKAYMYQFTRVSPGAKTFGIGAYHGSELRYVFDNTTGSSSMGLVKADHALAKVMAGAWVRFAKTGDPNGEGLVEWPAYTAENDAHLELGDTVRVSSGLRKAECDFFETVWTNLRVPAARKVAKRWF